jgi:hypothetical protein
MLNKLFIERHGMIFACKLPLAHNLFCGNQILIGLLKLFLSAI